MKYYLMTYLIIMSLSVTLTSFSTDNPILLPPEVEQSVPPVNFDDPDDNNEPEKPDNNDDYGSSCLVLCYESFKTSFSYTRLERVENPSGLASALDTGRVSVTFEM